MRLFSYFSSLNKVNSGNSSKSFALFMSTLSSFIISLFICGILAYDVYVNGYIRTDLEALAIFMVCVYTSIPASGVPKIFGERNFSRVKEEKKNEEELEN